MIHAYEAAVAHLNGLPVKEEDDKIISPLKGNELALFKIGKQIYERDGYCATCHQPDGKGLPGSGFPPLASSKWAVGNEDRLIKVVLKGLLGPIEVNGVKYAGQVPMTPFSGLLDDNEIAAVLTYVRNAFGNQAPPVHPERVQRIRALTKNKIDFYSPDILLMEHPLEK
jgi:mono/diheme cytochrome c family protein